MMTHTKTLKDGRTLTLTPADDGWTARIDGEVVVEAGTIGPVKANDAGIRAALGGKIALTAADLDAMDQIRRAVAAAREAARVAALSPIDLLIERRGALVLTLTTCERGAFPGTAAWRHERECMEALAAFDREHPEVLAEIRRREPKPGNYCGGNYPD